MMFILFIFFFGMGAQRLGLRNVLDFVHVIVVGYGILVCGIIVVGYI